MEQRRNTKNILHPRNDAPKMHCTIVITLIRHHQRCLFLAYQKRINIYTKDATHRRCSALEKFCKKRYNSPKLQHNRDASQQSCSISNIQHTKCASLKMPIHSIPKVHKHRCPLNSPKDPKLGKNASKWPKLVFFPIKCGH